MRTGKRVVVTWKRGKGRKEGKRSRVEGNEGREQEKKSRLHEGRRRRRLRRMGRGAGFEGRE